MRAQGRLEYLSFSYLLELGNPRIESKAHLDFSIETPYSLVGSTSKKITPNSADKTPLGA